MWCFRIELVAQHGYGWSNLMLDFDISYAKPSKTDIRSSRDKQSKYGISHQYSIYTSTVIYSLLHQFWLVPSILRFILKLYIIPISNTHHHNLLKPPVNLSSMKWWVQRIPRSEHVIEMIYNCYWHQGRLEFRTVHFNFQIWTRHLAAFASGHKSSSEFLQNARWRMYYVPTYQWNNSKLLFSAGKQCPRSTPLRLHINYAAGLEELSRQLHKERSTYSINHFSDTIALIPMGGSLSFIKRVSTVRYISAFIFSSTHPNFLEQ